MTLRPTINVYYPIFALFVLSLSIAVFLFQASQAQTSADKLEKKGDNPQRIVIKNNVIGDSPFGIYLGWNSRGGFLIEDNLIKDNGEGIRVVNKNNLIRGNQILDNLIGIKLASKHEGKKVTQLYGNRIIFNTITGNQEYGLLNLSQITVDASRNWWGSPQGPTKAGLPLSPSNRKSSSYSLFLAYWNHSLIPSPSIDFAQVLRLVNKQPTLSLSTTVASIAISGKYPLNLEVYPLNITDSQLLIDITYPNSFSPLTLWLYPREMKKADRVEGKIKLDPYLTGPPKEDKQDPSKEKSAQNNPKGDHNETYSGNATSKEISIGTLHNKTRPDFTALPVTTSSHHLFQFFFILNPIKTDRKAVSLKWEFGDGETSSIRNPVHNYYSYGFYPVTLTLTFEDGTTTTLHKILVISREGFELKHGRI